jgi:hypothetical protein
LNALLNEERAIVSEIAGTTRDHWRRTKSLAESVSIYRHGRNPRDTRCCGKHRNTQNIRKNRTVTGGISIW